MTASSCSGQPDPINKTDTSSAPEITAAVISETEAEETTVSAVTQTQKSETSETEESSINTTIITEAPAESVSDNEKITQTQQSSSADISEEIIAEQTFAEQTTADTAAETPVSTTAVTTVKTTAETAAAATTKPPSVSPSPPKISYVSSDGINTSSCKKGTIDYSNISCGYVSAIYTGNKPLAKIRISCGDKNYDYTLTADGNYHYYPLSCGSGEYSVKMFEQADGSMYADVTGCTFNAAIKDEIRMFTYTNDRIRFSDKSECVKKASELCGGCSDDFEKIINIFDFVANNVTYDFELAAVVKSGYIPEPDKTLSIKKGICFDYAALMAAMLRSQGIPAKLVVGYASPDIYHAWNEVYTEKTGWITLEIFVKNSGFNLLDTTFYSTTADKKAIAAYMSDSSNYTKLYIY